MNLFIRNTSQRPPLLHAERLGLLTDNAKNSAVELVRTAKAAWENAMFERYTEKARRVIFFARYETSQMGAHSIETEHLLLGLLRVDTALVRRFLPFPNQLKLSI